MNRPDTGDRTAPAALNAQEIDVYAALAGGLYVYAAKTHTLATRAGLEQQPKVRNHLAT